MRKTEKGVYEYLFENEKTGEYVLSICADFADPYANDQDWGLCMNLE